jgi:hypothetical protein
MLTEVSLLVRLVQLPDRIPTPPPPDRRPRGKPRFYSDKLMLKALIIMIIRRLYTGERATRFSGAG